MIEDSESMSADVFCWLAKKVNQDFLQMGYPSIFLTKDNEEYISFCNLIKNSSSLLTMYKTSQNISNAEAASKKDSSGSSQVKKSDSSGDGAPKETKRWRFLSKGSRGNATKVKNKKSKKNRRKSEALYLNIIEKIKKDTSRMVELCHMSLEENSDCSSTAVTEDQSSEGQACLFLRKKWKLFRKEVVHNYNDLESTKTKLKNALEAAKSAPPVSCGDGPNEAAASVNNQIMAKSTASEMGSLITDSFSTSVSFVPPNYSSQIANNNESLHQKMGHARSLSKGCLNLPPQKSCIPIPVDWKYGDSGITAGSMAPRGCSLPRRARSFATASKGIAPPLIREPRFTSMSRVSELEAEIRRLKLEMERRERFFKNERDKLNKQVSRLTARLHHMTGRKIDSNTMFDHTQSVHETVKTQATKIDELSQEVRNQKNETDFYLKLVASLSDHIVKFSFDVSDFLGVDMTTDVVPEGENITNLLQKTTGEVMKKLKSLKEYSENFDSLKRRNMELLRLLKLVCEKLNIPESVLLDIRDLEFELSDVCRAVKEVSHLRREIKLLEDEVVAKRAGSNFMRRSTSQLSVTRNRPLDETTTDAQLMVLREKLLKRPDRRLEKSESTGSPECFNSQPDFDRKEIKNIISDIQSSIHKRR